MNNVFSASRKRNLRLFIFSMSGTLICFVAIAMFSYRYQEDSPLKGMFQRGVTEAEPQMSAPVQQRLPETAPAPQPATAEPARQEVIPIRENKPDIPEKRTTAVPDKASEPAATQPTEPGVDSKSVSAVMPAE